MFANKEIINELNDLGNRYKDENFKKLLIPTMEEIGDEKDSDEEMKAKMASFNRYITFRAAIKNHLEGIVLKGENQGDREAYFMMIKENIKEIAKVNGLGEADPLLIALLNLVDDLPSAEHEVQEVAVLRVLEQEKIAHQNNGALTAVLDAAINALETRDISLLYAAKTANPTYNQEKPSSWNPFSSPKTITIKAVENAERLFVMEQLHKLRSLSKLDLTDNKYALKTILSIKKNLDIISSNPNSAGTRALKLFLDTSEKREPEFLAFTKAVMLAIQSKSNEAILRSNGCFVTELYKRCANKYNLETALEHNQPIAPAMNALHSILLKQHENQQSPIAALGNEILFCLYPIPTPEETAALMAAGKKLKPTMSTPAQRALLQAGVGAPLPPVEAAELLEAKDDEKEEHEAAAVVQQAVPQLAPALVVASAAAPAPAPLQEVAMPNSAAAVKQPYTRGSVVATRAAMFQEHGNGAHSKEEVSHTPRTVGQVSERIQLSERMKALQAVVKLPGR